MRRVAHLFVALVALLLAGCSGLLSQHSSAAAGLSQGSAVADKTAVRALIFYAPGCGHCHHIITKLLPSLVDGKSVQVKAVNVWAEPGQSLYQAMSNHFKLKPQRQGVPTMLVGNQVLVGTDEIAQQYPQLLQQYRAAGLAWPAFEGLDDKLLKQLPDVGGIDEPTVWEKVASDPLGNGLSIAILLSMLLSFFYVTSVFCRFWRPLMQQPATVAAIQLRPAVALLSLLGLAVALYLAYVEASHNSVVCGPVGNCAAVQQSEYAKLLGVPVAYLGVLAYVAILWAWICAKVAKQGLLARAANWFVWLTSVGGVLFSIYLTFLEPFVIGATCAWCLTSAVVITSICLLVTRQFKKAAHSAHFA
ncbi:MAG: vitamin K epoxide reductase family protein [Myxococcota bacterium]